MTTFAALRTRCAQRFTDPSNAVVGDTGASSIRNWSDYVNDAYREVNRSSPLWPWLESAEQTVTVAANNRGNALPTDVLQVNFVYDTTNDRRVIPDQGRGSQYRGGYQLRSTTAQIPETYKLRSNQIELYPMPTANTTLAIECVLYPSALSADGDLPVFPAVWHEVLVDGALALAYLDDGNMDEFKILDGRFHENIQRMLASLLTFRSETYPPVRDAFWG